MLLIGIDVGGTYTKFGLIEDGKIIRSMKLATNTFDVIRQLVNGAKELVQNEGRSFDDIEGIGVGFPGLVVDSVVLESANIGLHNCNIQEILSEEFGKPVVVKNDAEMATLAEHRLGAGENCKDMILITFGTGVGGGIVTNGRLYEGKGGAGELGHIVLDYDGKECACGRKGCAEQYISMKALDKLARDIMGGYPNNCIATSGDGLIYASEIMRAYKKNDACAKEIVVRYVDLVTTYLLDICNLFRPEKIVIGGGITYAPELISLIEKSCKDHDYGYKNSPKVDIVPASLGNDAGVLGTIVCFDGENEEYLTTTQSILNEYDEYMERQALENEVTEESVIQEDVEDLAQEQFASNSEDEDTGSDLLNEMFSASNEAQEEYEDDEEPVYDQELLDRVNDMLKKKD